MKITDFFLGKFDHKFWKNRLCLILIGEFLGKVGNTSHFPTIQKNEQVLCNIFMANV